ncbi:MAG TPA: sensor domain-containing diguanylate cyclase [Symbiobacteriaceae bacterium]|nr:sensor domain-containing diguanylate cyclase [Symbiobacteriaceae bacterium]
MDWLLMALLLGLLCITTGLAVRARRLSRELVAAQAKLKQAEQRLGALHQIALSLSTTLDLSRLLETILEQLGRLWGYHHGAILLHDPDTDELVVAASRAYCHAPGQRFPADRGITGAVFTGGKALVIDDVTRDHRYIDGVAGAHSELAVPLMWEGHVLGVLNVESHQVKAYSSTDLDLLTTVAEQAAAAIGNARLHQETRHLAITDQHTGLYNYRHFQEQLAATVREAQLTGMPAALFMVDLDFFKRCNDTYGHPTGDVVLEQLARLLRESCRADDQVFRYGGEEFTIILPGTTDADALRVAERIRERVAQHSFLTRSGRRLDWPVTVSIGVASYPRDGLSEVDLLIAADRAMYAAKARGRNRVVSAAAGAPALLA